MKANFTRCNPFIMLPKRRYALVLAFLMTMTNVMGQGILVKGKVAQASDSQGIPGVSILVKGTTAGTLTNVEGDYELNAAPGAILVYSSVGYETQEIAVGNKTQIDVKLKEDVRALTEVVVTALGIKKDVRTVGYSTQEIKGSEMTKAREPNAINSLTGKIAGLTIGASAEMLGRPQIVLRGSTDVLFVVDGVPVNSDTWNMNGDDIETYTVLKGPNAAALYGSRGLNGAILVTTKKGSRDKRGFSVEFNSSTMMEKGFIALPKDQTEYGYGTDYKYAYGNNEYDLDGAYRRANIWGPRFDGQNVPQWDSPVVNGVRQGTPWLAKRKDNFKNFMQAGLLSNNNISLSASGEKYDLRISGTHTYQKGMSPNTKLSIDNLNINAGYNFTPKLKMEAGLNFNTQYTPNIPDASYGPNSFQYLFKVYGSASYDIADMKDYWKVDNLQQKFVEYGRINNPYFTSYEWLHGHYKTDVFGNLKLSYKISDDLNVAVRTQVTTWNQLRTEKVPPSTNLNGYYNGYYFGWYGDYREDRRSLIENNTDILANYNKKIAHDFNLGLTAGANLRTFKYNSTWASTYQLAIPKVYNLAASKNPVKAYTFGSDMQVYSAYYSADLGYKGLININTTGRVDNLSTLPTGKQTFFYPSVSASSVVNEYVKLPEVISFLKIRASYAKVKGGLTTSTIGSAYNALYGTTLSSGLLGYGSEVYTSYDGPSYTNQNSYSSNSYYNNTGSVTYSKNLANPNIKPQTNTSSEVGADIKFFGNRLGAEFTYFRSVNGPLIYQLPVAPSTSYASQSVNAITTLKKGWELSINGSPVKANGFTWDVMLNVSTYKETLKDIYEGLNQVLLNNHNYKVGERMDAYYGRKYVRSQDGQIIHAGGLPIAQQSGTDNMQLLGHTNPNYVYGLNNRFTYKNMSFSFQFDGRLGGKIFDYVYAQATNAGSAIETASGEYGAARTTEWLSTNGGTVNATPAFVGKGVVITGGTPHYTNGQIDNYNQLEFAPNTTPTLVRAYIQNGVYNSFDEPFMINRSYLKLREVVFTYNLPDKILAKTKLFKAANISLVGRNLLYFAERTDLDLDQYAAGFNISNTALGGKQNDLQSSTARRYGFNLNLIF